MAPDVRSLEDVTRDAVARAMGAVLPPELADADPVVRRSDRADFQANAALSLAKKIGAKPRELAESIATVFVPLAAVGLILLMIGAAITHGRRKEYPFVAGNVVLIVLALIVAWARFGAYSL